MTRKFNRREMLASGAMLAASLAGGSARADDRRPKEAMKLGLISYNVAKDWDIPAILRNCQAAGFEGFEARTGHAHGIEPSLPPARRQEIKQQFADAGITLWGLGSVCEFHSADPAVVTKNIEDCKAFVSLARDLGTRGVKVRPNGLRKDMPAEKTLEQIAHALQSCGQIGADHGIEIWVEVHGAETQKPANIRRILDLCGHKNVGVCWNSNHTDIEDGSIKAAFGLLRPFLRSCHINDLWGDYPYRELFAQFHAAGYDRFTLCEVGTPLPADTGATFLKCYRGLWKELQR